MEPISREQQPRKSLPPLLLPSSLHFSTIEMQTAMWLNVIDRRD